MADFFAQHYNMIVILLSTTMLGISAGLMGCFLVLRKEALIADAVSHATLPGIGIGFLIAYTLEYDDGRFIPLLLSCAALTAFLGAKSVQYITNHTKLHPDTAIASTMSFFYGVGLILLNIIQNLETGNKAGLNSFLLGQVSGLTRIDLIMLFTVSVLSILLIYINYKTFRLLCFDKTYAQLIGMKTKITERLMLLLMILIVCVGLKTVGLILIVALLITPAVTARLWCNTTEAMLVTAACLGALSCAIGVYLSSLYTLPTGAVIVMTSFSLFCLSLIIRKLKHV